MQPRDSAPDGAFAAEPCIFTTDLNAATEFYRGKLGFRLVTTYGDPPYFAHVERASARLALRHVDVPVMDPQRRIAEDLLSAAITVPDIERLHGEYQQAGVMLHRDLATEAWGARTFIVRDPDAI